MKIPHLRSCYEQVGGVAYFGRMVDKIRLHDAGLLPAEYHENLGQGFDGRIVRFLGIGYEALQAEVRHGRNDDELIRWALTRGAKPSEERIAIFNGFLAKLGWRDARRDALLQRLRDGGFPADAAATHFDFIDLDEGRPLRFAPDPAPVAVPPRPGLEGLRSPYDTVGGVVHFGRMLDKIRLHASRKLPSDYLPALGDAMALGYDSRVCRLLDIPYPRIVEQVKRGGTDEELLEWACREGRRPDEAELEIFNGFMSKRGWHDESTDRLHFRLREAGLPLAAARTMFDFIDLDEGRPLRFPA